MTSYHLLQVNNFYKKMKLTAHLTDWWIIWNLFLIFSKLQFKLYICVQPSLPRPGNCDLQRESVGCGGRSSWTLQSGSWTESFQQETRVENMKDPPMHAQGVPRKVFSLQPRIHLWMKDPRLLVSHETHCSGTLRLSWPVETKEWSKYVRSSFLTFKCPRGPSFAPQGIKLKYLLSIVVIVQTSCDLKFPKLWYPSELSKFI